MAYALGLADSIVGITHECDYPPEVKTKPVVVRNVLPIETMTQAEIDRAVAERMGSGQSLYQIDEQLLCELAPDLILTQDLCQVCAPSGNEVSQVINALPKAPQVLWLTPQSLDEIFENIRQLGTATDRVAQAEALIDDCRARLAQLARRTKTVSHTPRVFCMEWLDPVFASGHWVPELVKIAGGVDELGKERGESVRVPWDEIVKWAPEVLIIMPCGFNLQQTMKQTWDVFGRQTRMPFFDLPAVRNNRVYAVDANSYFARPGPRVVEGAELLAKIIHPELFDPTLSANEFQQIDVGLLRGSLDEEKDYYFENGFMVFTASYLRRRGYCCGNGCRHCPY